MDNSEKSSIISGLIRKSEKNEVNWIHTSEIDPRISDLHDDYTVKLDKSSINIYGFPIDSDSQKRVGFLILNDRGKEIFREVYTPHDDLYGNIDALIDLAANKADNVDETINSIQYELRSSGEIGHSSTDNEPPF